MSRPARPARPLLSKPSVLRKRREDEHYLFPWEGGVQKGWSRVCLVLKCHGRRMLEDAAAAANYNMDEQANYNIYVWLAQRGFAYLGSFSLSKCSSGSRACLGCVERVARRARHATCLWLCSAVAGLGRGEGLERVSSWHLRPLCNVGFLYWLFGRKIASTHTAGSTLACLGSLCSLCRARHSSSYFSERHSSSFRLQPHSCYSPRPAPGSHDLLL